MLILFDLSAFVHRAFHGQPFWAARLSLGWAARLLKHHKPTHAAACVDRPYPTFRHDLARVNGFGYKGKGRTEGDERARIQAQLTLAEDLVVDCLGVPSVWSEGFEADDAMATLAARGAAAGLDVLIACKDKDLAQCVTDRVRLVDFMTGSISGPSEVEERFGVPPSRFVDYLALVGDSSDCYPGCPGIGPKGARELISKFPSLDAMLGWSREREFGQQPTSVSKRLEAGAASVRLSQQLAELRVDVPLTETLEDLEALPWAELAAREVESLDA